MKTVNKLTNRAQVWAQIFLLLCTYTFIPAGFASSKNELDYTDLNQLARLETVIYGFAHKNLPNEKRVDSLEKILFGRTHSGPLHSRIISIANTLGSTSDNALAPPLAPGLDRPDTLRGEAPRVAEENDLQSYDNDIKPSSDAKRDRINNSLQQAMQLYSQGETSQAETIFKNVLSLDNKNADANFNLGAIAEGRSDWGNALHYYQEALKTNPNDQDTQKAVESMKSKLATANNQVRSSSKQAKLSGQQLNALKAKVDQAANDYAKGNYDSAISNLKAVVAQAPDQADVYYALGQAYKAKNQNSQAADAFNQAVTLAPDNKQYADALAELNSKGQTPNSMANRGVDTYSSNNPDLGKAKNKPGQNNLANANQNNSDWTPETPGEITPFSDQGSNNQLGWQPAGAANGGAYSGAYYAPGMNSAYMPGYTYSNYIPYSMTTMIERAAFSGLAGAAMGSMLSSPSYRSPGFFSGSMGGMMGFRGGRHR